MSTSPSRIVSLALTYLLVFTLLYPSSALAQDYDMSKPAKPMLAGSCHDYPLSWTGGVKKEVCYYYNSITRPTLYGVRGAEVTLSVHRPKVLEGEHSVAELALGTKDYRHFVETGWIAKRGVSGKVVTELFVFFWINRQGGFNGGQCFNLGCGFVHTSRKYTPGMELQPGTKIKLKTIFDNNRWEVWVNDELMGYYPASLWNGEFKRAETISAYGEVASRSRYGTETQMGNGRNGASKNAATMEGFRVFGRKKGDYTHYNFSNGGAQDDGYDLGGINFRCQNVCSVRYGGSGISQ